MKKITKISVSVLLLLSMLLTMMPMVATATDDVQATATPTNDGPSYYTGNSDVINAAKKGFLENGKTTIDSADELVAFAQASSSMATIFKNNSAIDSYPLSIGNI